jgi:NAD(P)-dependent dehydrogenase (short-subunit alcohol dehydrogenase family)
MQVKLKPLSDQVAVVTGASSGIGLATARVLAERGAKVVLAARNGEALERAAGEIRDRGGDAFHVAVDVSKREDLERLASETVARHGGFDTWVNNAG